MADVVSMIREIKERYSLDSPKVFSAMLQVPREKFVPDKYRDRAYDDCPLSLGYGQTISQPYTVAFMTDLLGLQGNETVLEIGTGSGYQAAVLALLADKVYTIEVIPELAGKAKKRLKKLGYRNIEVKTGGGELGWSQNAPYDAILVTAGMKAVPKMLFRQLKEGGILVAPVGKGMDKEMTRYTKLKNKKTKELKKEEFGIFHFVPFVEK